MERSLHIYHKEKNGPHGVKRNVGKKGTGKMGTEKRAQEKWAQEKVHK